MWFGVRQGISELSLVENRYKNKMMWVKRKTAEDYSNQSIVFNKL